MVKEIVNHLLEHYFRNKKEMAREINVSYRSLLNCCTGKGTRQSINTVTAKLIRYCMEKRIALSDAINLPA